jgi:hypothetical protein
MRGKILEAFSENFFLLFPHLLRGCSQTQILKMIRGFRVGFTSDKAGARL